jgi:hypothetical protein
MQALNLNCPRTSATGSMEPAAAAAGPAGARRLPVKRPSAPVLSATSASPPTSPTSASPTLMQQRRSFQFESPKRLGVGLGARDLCQVSGRRVPPTPLLPPPPPSLPRLSPHPGLCHRRCRPCRS